MARVSDMRLLLAAGIVIIALVSTSVAIPTGKVHSEHVSAHQQSVNNNHGQDSSDTANPAATDSTLPVNAEDLLAKVMSAHSDSACPSGSFVIAESIPEGVTLAANMSTTEAWIELLEAAKHTVHIAAFYMTLTGGDIDGQLVYNALLGAALRGVQVSIAISTPSPSMPDTDLLSLLNSSPNIQAVYVNMSVFFGSGVQHSKFFIIDDVNLYIGSANLDWRSLTQVKELGIMVRNCPLLAQDLDKVFGTFWYAGSANALPAHWPIHLHTQYTAESPATVTLNQTSAQVYITTAPTGFCPPERTYDLASIQATMAAATETIDLEVMDYIPLVIYSTPNYYWGLIDDSIRSAAFRGVQVRMLIAHWNYSDPEMLQYLDSLDVLTNVEVRLMVIPIIEPYVPYTRVNHAKFMVTEQTAFISTSNWVGDYFITTAGASLVTNHAMVRDSVQSAFDRDWTSTYTQSLPAFLPNSPRYSPCQ